MCDLSKIPALEGLVVIDSDRPRNGTFTKKGSMKLLKVLDISNMSKPLNPLTFYTYFGHEPVIVRGLYRTTKCLQNLSRPVVSEHLKGQKIWAWHRKTGQGDYIPSEDIFADLDKPRPERVYNVVDHPVSVDTLGEEIQVPSFLTENWFLNNPFNTDYYRLNVTISAVDTWTPLHVDNNGMQGWMYLAYGEKEWQLFSPDQAQLLYDPVFKMFVNERTVPTSAHPSGPSTSAAPLSAPKGASTADSKSNTHAPVSSSFSTAFPNPTMRKNGHWPHMHLAQGLEGVARGGDLLWFPPGWAHQVATFVESFGIGGSVLNHYLAEEAAFSVLSDRANFFNTSLDVPAVFKAVSEQEGRMPSDPKEREAAERRVQSALHLFEQWDLRHKEIVSGEASY